MCWIKDLTADIDHFDQLEDAFNKFDADGNGSLDLEEFKKYMKTRGDALSGAEIDNLDKMFQECDKNDNGGIDISEFTRFVMN